jgi:hypothetical protein
MRKLQQFAAPQPVLTVVPDTPHVPYRQDASRNDSEMNLERR